VTGEMIRKQRLGTSGLYDGEGLVRSQKGFHRDTVSFFGGRNIVIHNIHFVAVVYII